MYNNGDYEAINNELRDFLPAFESNFDSRSLKSNWLVFRDKVIELANKYVPKMNFPANKNKPWFSKRLKRQENKKKRLFRTTTLPIMAPVEFSVAGISSLINILQLSSSAGVDNINSKLLRNNKQIIAEYFSMLFSLSLETGMLPEDWKVGKVIPVHKSGNKQ